jgi:flagellar assembly protein FliH
MSIKLQRYDFGSLRDFRGPIAYAEPMNEQAETPPPPPPPVYDEADLELARVDAKKLGYQEGFLAGEANAKSLADVQTHQCQQTIIALSEQLADLDARYAETLSAQSREITQLAYTIAQKVAGAALDSNSVSVIASLVQHCLPVILNKPRAVIELHPDMIANSEAVLRQHLASERYEGEIIFHPNPAIAAHDVRINWGQGHAERKTADLWQEIESLLEKIPTSVTLAPSRDPARITLETNNNDVAITGE